MSLSVSPKRVETSHFRSLSIRLILQILSVSLYFSQNLSITAAESLVRSRDKLFDKPRRVSIGQDSFGFVTKKKKNLEFTNRNNFFFLISPETVRNYIIISERGLVQVIVVKIWLK